MKQQYIIINGKSRPICPICEKPIIRNLIAIDGIYYHYGCWKHGNRKPPKWLPLWICLHCGHVTSSPKRIIINGVEEKYCPRCDGPLKLLRRNRNEN